MGFQDVLIIGGTGSVIIATAAIALCRVSLCRSKFKGSRPEKHQCSFGALNDAEKETSHRDHLTAEMAKSTFILSCAPATLVASSFSDQSDAILNHDIQGDSNTSTADPSHEAKVISKGTNTERGITSAGSRKKDFMPPPVSEEHKPSHFMTDSSLEGSSKGIENEVSLAVRRVDVTLEESSGKYGEESNESFNEEPEFPFLDSMMLKKMIESDVHDITGCRSCYCPLKAQSSTKNSSPKNESGSVGIDITDGQVSSSTYRPDSWGSMQCSVDVYQVLTIPINASEYTKPYNDSSEQQVAETESLTSERNFFSVSLRPVTCLRSQDESVTASFPVNAVAKRQSQSTSSTCSFLAPNILRPLHDPNISSESGHHISLRSAVKRPSKWDMFGKENVLKNLMEAGRSSDTVKRAKARPGIFRRISEPVLKRFRVSKRNRSGGPVRGSKV